jgi:hypothetical protein
MIVKRVIKNISEIVETGIDLFLRRYPSFVYGGLLDKNEVPVFNLHSVEYEKFEKQLQFLSLNDYNTLTTEELYDIIQYKRTVPERSILLTFDDGMGSVWSIAYPLLKKYGFRATVFIIPGRIERQRSYYPNLEDFWEKRAKIEEVKARESGIQPMITWEEITIMHNSGIIDFQSHTLNHALVFTSPKIIDFVNPGFLSSFSVFEIPMIREDGHDLVVYKPELGTPLYSSQPRLSGARRYFDDEALRKKCISFVEENGGAEFFKKNSWRRELFRVVREYRERIGEDTGIYETDSEIREAILTELIESKRIIEEYLPGKEVRHLCYPWNCGSDLALELSKEAGYFSNFGAKFNNRFITRIGDAPYQIARVSEDFFFLLPGRDRISLTKVILEKFRYRFKSGSAYLTH